PLAEAVSRLVESEVGCLLVVSGDRMVGIVTERDFVEAAAELFAADER
ncbi:MAG: CBS domain-containing protein, partial [Actinobacteria bacterium]|nr:CBS domain-containing protein [Actinomycetota bacterium]NIU69528.1 CBS domain-containing protein [Actinomycetota bacterium]NIW31397.1 CBS domain-containing protein [Actinomycetota bacterium]